MVGMGNVVIDNGLGNVWEGLCGIQLVLFLIELH